MIKIRISVLTINHSQRHSPTFIKESAQNRQNSACKSWNSQMFNIETARLSKFTQMEIAFKIPENQVK